MKVFIIGYGNVGSSIHRVFEEVGVEVTGIFSRSKIENTSVEHYNNLSQIPTNADIYLISVSDDAIASVCNQIPKQVRDSKVIAHTSGTQSLEVLNSATYAGIFYPLQTFTKGQKIDFSDVPMLLYSTHDTVYTQLEALANKISSCVKRTNDADRKVIHLSAVMINNFVNHIIYKAEKNLEDHNIEKSLLQPLLLETIKKQEVLGAYAAQTGPAKRKDKLTIQKHIEMLDSEGDKKLYKNISKSIKKTYK